MSTNSRIEWTDATWNPVTGCTKISSGCQNCYAYTMAKRLKAMKNPRYKNGFEITMHEDLIEIPLTWKKPRKVFVNSMSDLFHNEIPSNFIYGVYNVMNKTPWHNYQVLTKRSERLLKIAPNIQWSSNIWQGVSIEEAKYKHRIDDLRKTPAVVKFLSVEPLIGPLGNLDLTGIDWVIVGGESGPGARQMEPNWVRDIRDQCKEQKVPFFFKQWGGVRKHLNGRILDGKTWSEFPAIKKPKVM